MGCPYHRLQYAVDHFAVQFQGKVSSNCAERLLLYACCAVCCISAVGDVIVIVMCVPYLSDKDGQRYI